MKVKMKEALLALATGASLVAPMAHADVTLSGSINMGVAYARSGESGGGLGNSVVGNLSTVTPTTSGYGRFSVTSNYSNVTISSVDDLGGGTKLDFAFQLVAPLKTNTAVANRNSHIGLVNESWGGVWYGSNENIYERYLYSIDPLDGAAGIGGNLQMLGTPGYGVVFDAPPGAPSNCTGSGLVAGTQNPFGGSACSGSAGFYRRTEHTIWYDSPNWNGLTFGLAWFMTPFNQGSGVLSNPTGLSAGVKYAGTTIPLQLWLAYEQHNDFNGLGVITARKASLGLAPGQGVPSDTKDKGLQLGGAWTLGDITIFGIFERLKYEADGLTAATDITQYARSAWAVGGKWNVATGYFGAQFISALDGSCEATGGCNASESGGWMLGAGYYHTLSRQSQAYIMGTYVANDDNQFYGIAGASTPNVAPGVDTWALTVGLKHSF